MSDVRWASLGLVVSLSAAAMSGCSDSTTSCTTNTPDGSTIPDMRPRTDAAVTPMSDAATPSGGKGALGSTCVAAADCAAGLTCLTPTDDVTPGEGVPGGLCTRDCTNDGRNDGCAPLGGTCLQFSDAPVKAYCVEDCVSGPTQQPKCHGRGDTACHTFVDNLGMDTGSACLPACSDDTDCGTRKCTARGLCADQPAAGLATGSPCVNDVDCLGGLCLDVAPTGAPKVGVCFASCRFGGLEGCGYRRNTPVSANIAACTFPLSAAPGDGDEAYCLELCDTDADCAYRSADWGCDTGASLVRQWGHGACFLRDPAMPADAGAVSSVDSARPDAAREAAPAAAPDAGAESAVDVGAD
jgi:hypothetical protein